MSKVKRLELTSKKKIAVNLVMADFYATEPEFIPNSAPSATYTELVEITQPDGSILEKLVEKPYEFTPEYVKSFEQSADYHLDPTGAVANAPKRKNLGDVTKIQEIQKMDSSALAELSVRLSQASEYLKAKEAQAKQSTVKGVIDNGNESK